MQKLKFLIPVLTILFVFAACDESDDPTVFETQSIVELVTGVPNLESLEAALIRADLVGALEGAGPFTVLAPSNEAFDNFLAANSFASLNSVPVDVLRQVLLNHVISGNLQSTDLSTGFATTLATSAANGSSMSIYIDTSDGVTFNGVSSVSNRDIQATNGTIHEVDAVIGLPTVVDLAIAAEATSTLVAAVSAANLVGTLSGDGPFTVLAPTNDAFGQFLTDNGFTGLDDIPTNVLTQTLLNHVIGGALEAGDLSTGYASTSATSAASDTEMSIYIDTSNGVRFNGVSSVAIANVVGNNGVIHVVDAVIALPTVVTFAVADPNFSTLVSALTTETPSTPFASILSRTMTGNADNIDPDFTVFAPTNVAFTALLDSNTMWSSLSDVGEPLLTNVLLHHVIAGANVRSSALTPNGDTVAGTLEGDDITISLPGTNTNIADVTDGSGNTGKGIIAVDVQANNGVIHVLNSVLLPN